MPLIKRDVIKSLAGSKRTMIMLLAIVVLAVCADIVVSRMLSRQFRLDQEVFVTLELGAFRARLEERVNTNLYLVYGMAANISVRPDISAAEYEGLARVLMGKSNALRNIAAAPDFVIRFMYPLEGNEQALGLDYRTVPGQWSQAFAAMESGKMAVAGPLDLVQGGVGLVARVPVFVDGSGRFWGLVSSVIDLGTLMQLAGVQPLTERLDLAVRGRDSKGPQGEVFWGSAALFGESAEAVTMTVSLPSGSWYMAAVPKGGWASGSPYAWMVHSSVLLLALLGIIARLQGSISRISLTESEQRMRAMSQASHDALVMIDADDRITFWNPAAENMFGYTESEMLGRKFHDVAVLPDEVGKAKTGLERFGKTGTGPILGRVMEMEGVRKSGEVFPVERSVAAFRLGREWFAVGSMRDISARKLVERRLNELATLDELTGLSNRRYFMEQADAQLKQAIRYRQEFCFMMFDLDHFKRINDTYGHDVGDEVLRGVGQTLRQVMRGTDIFGRVGGEEFAVAMPETGIEAARSVAERLREKFMEVRIQTWTKPVEFTVSIGIAHLDSPETMLSQLMKRADQTLYEAKRRGRNLVVTDEESVSPPSN